MLSMVICNHVYFDIFHHTLIDSTSYILKCSWLKNAVNAFFTVGNLHLSYMHSLMHSYIHLSVHIFADQWSNWRALWPLNAAWLRSIFVVLHFLLILLIYFFSFVFVSFCIIDQFGVLKLYLHLRAIHIQYAWRLLLRIWKDAFSFYQCAGNSRII